MRKYSFPRMRHETRHSTCQQGNLPNMYIVCVLEALFIHKTFYPLNLNSKSEDKRAAVLVAYSSSSEEDESNVPRKQQTPQHTEHDTHLSSPSLLPFPSSLLTLYQDHCEVIPNSVYTTTAPIIKFVDTDEESSFHDDRVRSFPHIRGQWATHIFIPCQ